MGSQPLAMRHHLMNYLAGTLSLDDLKERVIDATWDAGDAARSAECELALDVELALAEESSGYLTREELNADLRELLDRNALQTPA